jgi:hypothetical protein
MIAIYLSNGAEPIRGFLAITPRNVARYRWYCEAQNDNRRMRRLWHCSCGSSLWELEPTGAYCVSCGTYAWGWAK